MSEWNIPKEYLDQSKEIERLKAKVAKLEADTTCWTHGMNKEGTTGGMYLKENCPDCTARIANLEAELAEWIDWCDPDKDCPYPSLR